MALLTAIIAFIVTLGILVTVHEFGHFWVAKKLGIKVLRFSVGFGKVLKSWQIGETEYTICALPLGGFVKMLDETEGKVDIQEKHRAFNQQNVYKRIAVVVAGPMANFILAIILYTLIFMLGTQGIKPLVGVIENNSIAQHSGLQTGDQLLSINSKQTPSVAQFSINFLQDSNRSTMILKVVSATGNLKTLNLNLPGDFLANPEQGIEQYLGFKFAFPPLKPVINQVIPNQPADFAGIKSGDYILRANSNQIKTWDDFVALIQQNADQPIKLEVLRNRQVIKLLLIPKPEKGIAKAGVSVKAPDNYLDNHLVWIKKDFIDALVSANTRVYQLLKLNLIMIKRMILGETSIKQINGPISIASYAGKTAQIGLTSFLSFLALVSIGLGLLNLLPIPLLDGGHLFFYLIEILTGTPLGQVWQQAFIKLGFLLILSLMLIAMYNDFLRLFPST